jgi:hypothetical protein
VEPTGTRLTPFDPSHIAASPELWSRCRSEYARSNLPRMTRIARTLAHLA